MRVSTASGSLRVTTTDDFVFAVFDTEGAIKRLLIEKPYQPCPAMSRCLTVRPKGWFRLSVAKRTNPRQKEPSTLVRPLSPVPIALYLFRITALVALASLSAPVAAQSKSAPSKTQPAKPPAPKPVATPPVAPKAAPLDDNSATATVAPEIGPNETSTATSAEPSLPLPRFVSLRTDPVNLRNGPGVRYPVEWVYMRRRLPVEIIAEFETWRQIRDLDGAEGWVHQSMLSGRRTGMIKGEAQALRKANVDKAETLAMLEPGVVVDIQRCPADGPFCRVEIGSRQGWLKRDQFWGVYPQEKIE